jgi:hypothetical protein
LESQKAINPYYIDDQNNWGQMDDKKWKDFTNWLKSEKLIKIETLSDHQSLYTNDYL